MISQIGIVLSLHQTTPLFCSAGPNLQGGANDNTHLRFCLRGPFRIRSGQNKLIAKSSCEVA